MELIYYKSGMWYNIKDSILVWLPHIHCYNLYIVFIGKFFQEGYDIFLITFRKHIKHLQTFYIGEYSPHLLVKVYFIYTKYPWCYKHHLGFLLLHELGKNTLNGCRRYTEIIGYIGKRLFQGLHLYMVTKSISNFISVIY